MIVFQLMKESYISTLTKRRIIKGSELIVSSNKLGAVCGMHCLKTLTLSKIRYFKLQLKTNKTSKTFWMQ
jgi:hypothetical protein